MTFAFNDLGEKMPLSAWKQMSYELIWIYDHSVPGRYLSQTVHSSMQSAFLLRKGNLLIKTDKGEIRAGAGQWVFPKQGQRVQSFSADSSVLSIAYRWSWPGNQPLFDWDPALVLDASHTPSLEQVALRLKGVVDELFPGSDVQLKSTPSNITQYLRLHRSISEWVEACASVFHEINVLSVPSSIIDSRILEVVHCLDRHSLQSPYEERKIAHSVNLSPRQMDRLFTSHFGVTPRKYFEARRFDAAVERVRYSAEPFKRIAYDLGFRSSSHFSSWFQRKAALSPREIRNIMA